MIYRISLDKTEYYIEYHLMKNNYLIQNHFIFMYQY